MGGYACGHRAGVVNGDGEDRQIDALGERFNFIPIPGLQDPDLITGVGEPAC